MEKMGTAEPEPNLDEIFVQRERVKNPFVPIGKIALKLRSAFLSFVIIYELTFHACSLIYLSLLPKNVSFSNFKSVSYWMVAHYCYIELGFLPVRFEAF